MEKEGTVSEKKISRQIKESYEIMIKFGFPGFVSSSIAVTQTDIQKVMSDYVQPTIKRQNLIEWLILNINSGYSSQLQSRTNKKKNILNYLWQLGVMPFNKHTHNLDYEKYLQGLLGLENAVNLIKNLCILLKESHQYGKAKVDTRFSAFFDELMNNYESLVKTDYDPYKISFPAAYQHLEQEQFQGEFQQIMSQIKAQKVILQEGGEEEINGYDMVFKQFQTNKTKFQQTYFSLIEKMKQIIDKNGVMIQNWQKPSDFSGRTLKISANLPKLYRQYKQKVKLSKLVSSSLKEQRVRIKALIQSINETVCI